MQQLYKKSSLLLLLILLCTFGTYAQDILWEKSYGGKHAEYLFDAIPTPDYGFILAGSSISDKNGNKSEQGKGNLDYWVWKMSEKGELDWQKNFGGTETDLLESIRLTPDGGFVLGGTSNSGKGEDKKENSKGQADFWIIKLNAKGGELWQKTIGGTGNEKLHSINVTKDGGYILGGTSTSDKSPKDAKGNRDVYGKSEDSRGGTDFWVVKLNGNGDVEWQRTIGGKYNDELKKIITTIDGGFMIGDIPIRRHRKIKKENNIGTGDYWVMKLDPKGTTEWEKTIGGDRDDHLFDLIQTKDGGFLLGGNSNSDATNSKTKSNIDGADFWILKLDPDGMVSWQQTYNYGKSDILTSVTENEDGTFLIAGYAKSEKQAGTHKSNRKTASDAEGINDYIALKIDSKGEEIWSQTIGSSGDDILKKLFVTRDEGYLLVGISDGKKSRDRETSIGGNDFWAVKLKDKDKKKKDREQMEAIPNPATDFTNVIINFDYDHGTAVLYDMNGRQLSSQKINGERTVPVELGNIPQGIYIISVKTNKGENAVKVIKK